MKRFWVDIFLIALSFVCVCWYDSSLAATLKEKAVIDEEFIAHQQRIIEEHADVLRALRRFDSENPMSDSILLGKYQWLDGLCKDMGSTPCIFGTYIFSDVSFQQAKRVWRGYMRMAVGSDLLVAPDLKFDPSIIGYRVSGLTYCSLQDGRLIHCGPGDNLLDLAVVGFVDEHTVRVDKTARWDAEMYHSLATPPDFVDMCNCTLGSN